MVSRYVRYLHDRLGRKRDARSTKGEIMDDVAVPAPGSLAENNPEPGLRWPRVVLSLGLVLIRAATTVTSIVLWPRSAEPVTASAPARSQPPTCRHRTCSSAMATPYGRTTTLPTPSTRSEERRVGKEGEHRRA